MSSIAGQPKGVAKAVNPEPGYYSITPLQQEYEEVALKLPPISKDRTSFASLPDFSCLPLGPGTSTPQMHDNYIIEVPVEAERVAEVSTESSFLPNPQIDQTSQNKRSKKQQHGKEESHFIRYLKIDRCLDWETIESEVKAQFEWRSISGIQSIYYRDNASLPALEVTTNRLKYLPNGHTQPEKVGRKNINNLNKSGVRLYGLLNLFPEDALNYSWVLDEHRGYTQGLGKYRLPSLRLCYFDNF